MCDYLADVMQEEQTCVVPERRVSQIQWLMTDIISDVQERKRNMVLMNLDLEKTYDWVEHDFNFEVLWRMGSDESKCYTVKWEVKYW